MTRTPVAVTRRSDDVRTIPARVAAPTRPARRTVNITPAERVGRMLIGVVAV